MPLCLRKLSFYFYKFTFNMASDHFHPVVKTKANSLIDVVKYTSDKSGLSVVFGDVQGPMVSGHMCLATKTDTDDGLPHILEHLIFLGSRNYPYRGLLDLLANRCMASGTNAFTEQDHTCYTLETVGVDGFMKMMPIYLDHILHPLLRDSAFLTEVYHINGKGEDAGVVYSEMQNYESKMHWITYWKFQQLMYPKGSGYEVETGARLENLRNSCNNTMVRKYHKAFYHLRNITVVVTGIFDHAKVLDMLASVEDEALKNSMELKVNDNFQKPFSGDISPLTESIEVEVACPADDTSHGTVVIGWRGPKAQDLYKYWSVLVLCEYLCDTAVAPLQRDFIQLDDPSCSNIDWTVYEHSVSAIVFTFNGVPVQKLSEIRPKLFGTLGNLLSGKDNFDIHRIKSLIIQSVYKLQEQLETDPHSTVANMVIGDQLYGETDQDFEYRLNTVAILKRLAHETVDFWVSVLGQYFDAAIPYVCVIGKPSHDYVEELVKEEEARIDSRQKQLGSKGLKKCEDALEAAIEENGIEPDESVINDCIVNTLDGVYFVSLTSSTNLSQSQDTNENFHLNKMPFASMLDDCSTNFVELTALLNIEHLPIHLRPYLLLWTELLFESPIRIDDTILPYEQAVKDISRDLVDYSVSNGIGGQFQRLMVLHIKVDNDDYLKGILWLKRFIFDLVFTEERIRVVVQSLLNSSAARKRKGKTVANFLLGHIIHEHYSTPYILNALRQEQFCKVLLEKLEKEPDKVLTLFDQLKSYLSSPGHLAVHIMANCHRLAQLHGLKMEEPWCTTFQDINHTCKIKNDSAAEPTFLNKANKGIGAVIPLGASESAFICQVIPSIDDCNHPDLPPMMVFLNYLDQTDGLLYRKIRGKGLAYSIKTYIEPEQGLLCLRLHKCSQPVEAYEQTRKIVSDVLDGVLQLDKAEFEAAKRSLIFEVIEREGTVSAASLQSLLSHYRKVSQHYNRELCDKIWKVKMDEMLAIARKHVPELFNFSLANTAITCHPSKLNEVVEGFEKMGKKLKVMSIEDSELYI